MLGCQRVHIFLIVELQT